MKNTQLVKSPFTIAGEHVMCIPLTALDHQYFFRNNLFTSVWDDNNCEVGLVVNEIGEYEVKETYYIYFFEGEE